VDGKRSCGRPKNSWKEAVDKDSIAHGIGNWNSNSTNWSWIDKMMSHTQSISVKKCVKYTEKRTSDGRRNDNSLALCEFKLRQRREQILIFFCVSLLSYTMEIWKKRRGKKLNGNKWFVAFSFSSFASSIHSAVMIIVSNCSKCSTNSRINFFLPYSCSSIFIKMEKYLPCH